MAGKKKAEEKYFAYSEEDGLLDGPYVTLDLAIETAKEIHRSQNDECYDVYVVQLIGTIEPPEDGGGVWTPV